MDALQRTGLRLNKNYLLPSQSQPYRNSSANSSSLSDDRTVDLNSRSKQYFNPSEMTGRSTECVTTDASLSVEQILSESQCSPVRALANELKEFKIRESHGGEQLARTADVSLTSSKSFRSSMSKPDDWAANDQSDINVSEVFMPSDRVKDFLKNEEELWDQEYATLPPNQEMNSQPEEHAKQNAFELSDFSRFRFGNV